MTDDELRTFARDMASQDSVWELRQTYWRNGYRPASIYTGQKRPRGNHWRNDALANPPLWAGRLPEEEALSTGIATGEAVGIDIDVRDQAIVQIICKSVAAILGPTLLIRIGVQPTG